MNKKKREKIAELAKILLAINNLEKRCVTRKGALQYPLDKIVNAHDPGNMGNIELFKKKAEYAKSQLIYIH